MNLYEVMRGMRLFVPDLDFQKFTLIFYAGSGKKYKINGCTILKEDGKICFFENKVPNTNRFAGEITIDDVHKPDEIEVTTNDQY